MCPEVARSWRALLHPKVEWSQRSWWCPAVAQLGKSPGPPEVVPMWSSLWRLEVAQWWRSRWHIEVAQLGSSLWHPEVAHTEITAVPLRFSNTMGWPSGEFTVAPREMEVVGGALKGDKACRSPWHLVWGTGQWGSQ